VDHTKWKNYNQKLNAEGESLQDEYTLFGQRDKRNASLQYLNRHYRPNETTIKTLIPSNKIG
jgi:hypothetical protein